MATPELEAIGAKVRGHVQGVYYRAFVRKEAEALGLCGYARNLPNGEVEVYAQGKGVDLKRLVEKLKMGPPAAVVSSVELKWLPTKISLDGFEIK